MTEALLPQPIYDVIRDFNQEELNVVSDQARIGQILNYYRNKNVFRMLSYKPRFQDSDRLIYSEFTEEGYLNYADQIIHALQVGDKFGCKFRKNKFVSPLYFPAQEFGEVLQANIENPIRPIDPKFVFMGQIRQISIQPKDANVRENEKDEFKRALVYWELDTTSTPVMGFRHIAIPGENILAFLHLKKEYHGRVSPYKSARVRAGQSRKPNKFSQFPFVVRSGRE